MGFGMLKPNNKILGADAGRVEAVGNKVAQFDPGDEVFGHLSGFGRFAKYIRAPETLLAKKLANLMFEQVAAGSPYASSHCLAGITRQRATSIRTKGSHSRRVQWRRDI